ncbi:MAG: pantothenate kinase [Flavobacteriales bacterium]|jgi:type III pantothenate kinase|nr:pantothenate kinase [Flavobacteriales bacterium]|tara:strand:+ start:342 stop:1067 length:726 start_codon:yes stop_codon:yes gene_type:complete
MNLVLDVGNTSTKLALFAKNTIIEFIVINNFSIPYLREYIENRQDIKYLYYSNTSLSRKDIGNLCEELDVKYSDINHTSKLPIKISYSTPETLGSDRIALACGAAQQYSGNNLIIDFGTCITYDLVLGNEYIGGQISPGLDMRLNALNYYTENLPKIVFKTPNVYIGNSTSNSILVGVYEGIIFEVNGIIEKYKLRYPNINIITTGGAAKIFNKKIKNINFFDSHLLMHGINYIIATNEQL